MSHEFTLAPLSGGPGNDPPELQGMELRCHLKEGAYVVQVVRTSDSVDRPSRPQHQQLTPPRKLLTQEFQDVLSGWHRDGADAWKTLEKCLSGTDLDPHFGYPVVRFSGGESEDGVRLWLSKLVELVSSDVKLVPRPSKSEQALEESEPKKPRGSW